LLTRTEVRRILDACSNPKHRVLLHNGGRKEGFGYIGRVAARSYDIYITNDRFLGIPYESSGRSSGEEFGGQYTYLQIASPGSGKLKGKE
jgi:hypothetical protein